MITVSYNAVLVALLEHIALTDQPVVIGWRTARQWPEGALKRFLAAGLLVKASPAESIECAGCENACFMDVLIHPSGSSKPPRAFVVCDDPGMQGEMGRINISLDHLQQWKTSAKQLAKVVAELLDLDLKPEETKHQASIRLGMLTSTKGRRWVSLNAKPLALEINQHIAPVEEVLYFEGETLVIDRPRINDMLVAVAPGKDNRYTASTSKREDGKRNTEAMHQDWHDAYVRLQRQYPDKSAVWISKKIEAMPIAQGVKAATIYRKMKG